MPELKLNFFEEFCIIENEKVFEVNNIFDLIVVLGLLFADRHIDEYKFKLFLIDAFFKLFNQNQIKVWIIGRILL